ncbi:MAG: hypothetical protein K5685_06515 [Bacteroidales bacterium]|nr:hypothetical protein [Bacteroidales bacterium]
MATKKEKKFSTSMRGFKCMNGFDGFSKKGKNADGVNITFADIVHAAQKSIQKEEGTKVSLKLIETTVKHICSSISDILGEGQKVCVTVPQLGNFKTSIRSYKIGGKQGKTKTVKFTPCSAFKEKAKLGKK